MTGKVISISDNPIKSNEPIENSMASTNASVKIYMDRPLFVWSQRIGKTLDLGCNDGSLVKHGHNLMSQQFNHDNDWLISFDIDKWNLPNFIRGDAHRLPFKNNVFDTVIMSDMLEHTPDPVKILKEAHRISKNRIIITLPNEAEWHPGMNALGKTEMSHDDQIANTLGHPSKYAKCLDFVREDIMRHQPHIHTFDFYTIYELITRAIGAKYKVNIMSMYHDNPDKQGFPDTPYWGITIDLQCDISNFKYGITDLG